VESAKDEGVVITLEVSGPGAPKMSRASQSSH